MRSLSVVSPLYRTSAHFPEFVERLSGVLDDVAVDWDIVAIDDHCPEGSGYRAAGVDGQGRLSVYRLDRNVGQHAATALGIRLSRGELVAVLDADLQDPPEALPRLLTGLDDDVDVVVATRRGRHQGPGRRFTGSVFRTARWAVTAGRIPPGAGMFLVARRRSFDEVFALGDPSIHLISGLSRVGARFRAMPVVRAPRPSGGSAFSSPMRIRLGVDALLTATPAQPAVSRLRSRRWTEPAVEVITEAKVRGGSPS